MDQESVVSKQNVHFSIYSIHFCLETTYTTRIYRKMAIYGHFFYIIYKVYIFASIQHKCLANTVFILDPSNNVIKRLWCMSK